MSKEMRAAGRYVCRISAHYISQVETRARNLEAHYGGRIELRNLDLDLDLRRDSADLWAVEEPTGLLRDPGLATGEEYAYAGGVATFVLAPGRDRYWVSEGASSNA